MFIAEEIVSLVVGIICVSITIPTGIYLISDGNSESTFWGIILLALGSFCLWLCGVVIKKIVAKRPSTFIRTKETYVDIISKQIVGNESLNKQFNDALILPNLSLLVPPTQVLRYSCLWNYYKYFYKDNNSLAILYVIMNNPEAAETRHPLNDEMIKTFDSLDEITERVLITYPWLIRLDAMGNQYRKES